MASLFLGRRVGPEGFSRLVAIKVIHAHLANDRAFVEMFLDEARLSSRIVHPNVVRVEELGEQDGVFFLAMEFVHGATLSALMSALTRANRPLLPAVACAIAMRTADGLHAAHEVTDDAGVSLEVIHRDVSPQNILLSDSGHVKLIDFGVAKARGRRQSSEAGALKGKLGYMAPEQAWGRPIDRRADIYALGVVLWEMLTRQRLLTGDSEIAVLEAARAPQVRPPHEVDPSISTAISGVVMTALAPDPADRFQTANAFRRALGNACPEAIAVEPEHIAALLRSALGDELERERYLLQSEPRASLVSPRASLASPRVSAASPPPEPERDAATMASRPSRIDPATSDERASRAPAPAGVARSPALAVGVIACGLVALGALGGVGWKRLIAQRAAPAAPARSTTDRDAVRDLCADKVSMTLAEDGQASLSLDTRGRAPGRFTLGSLRVTQTPEAIVELRAGGAGPRSVELTTANTGTDVRYDTVLAVYRGPCAEAFTQRAPDASGDDQPADREFRASTALQAQGGDVLTVVVAGFGGLFGGRADRGLVQLDAVNRQSRAPAIESVSLLAGDHRLMADTRASDPDSDIAKLDVRLLASDGRAIVSNDRAGVVTLEFDAPTDDPSVHETASVDLPPEVDLAAAAFAEVRVVDRPGNSSPPTRVPIVHGAVVGPGARCDATHACAAELTCDPRGRCRASLDRVEACDEAPAVEFTFGADGVGRASHHGRVLPGAGLFSGACARSATSGREQVVRLRVPPGRWALVASLDDDTWDGGLRLEPDTILYLRRSCLDSSHASAPMALCNDDISFRVNQRSRVEARPVSGGDLFAFVEIWGSSLTDGHGDRYTLALTLTPVAEGAPRDAR